MVGVTRRLLEDVGRALALRLEAHPRRVNLPDGEWGGWRQTHVEQSRNAVLRAEREGRLSWGYLWEEAGALVLAETDPADIRRCLVEALAIGVAWANDIDGRQK